MSSRKPIFIIPGYRHGPTNKAYIALSVMLKNQGYDPILMEIPWKKNTISENTEYFLRHYNKIKTKKKYILGFSYGAMIAFLAATKADVAGLILCSLSPYFSEDLAKQKSVGLSPIKADRHQDFLQLHSETLAKQIKAEQVLFLYGAKEARSLIRRVKQTHLQIASSNKMLVAIKNTDHNLGDKRYLQTIHLAAQTLN